MHVLFQSDSTRLLQLVFFDQHLNHGRLRALSLFQPLGGLPLDQGGDTLQLGGVVRPEDAVLVLPEVPGSHSDVEEDGLIVQLIHRAIHDRLGGDTVRTPTLAYI